MDPQEVISGDEQSAVIVISLELQIVLYYFVA